MQDNSQQAVSRRQLVSGLVAAAAGGGVWLTVGARPVTAQVAPDGLSVSDASTETVDGTAVTPHVSVDAGYAYDGVEEASAVLVALLIDGGLVDDVVTSTSAGSDSGTEQLSAAVVDSRMWSAEDWAVPDDGSVSHDVAFELRLEVRNSNGETLAKDSATDTATVAMSDGGASLSAGVGGDGSVTFQTPE